MERGADRAASLLATLAASVLLAVLLGAIAVGLPLGLATTHEWVAHAALNALAVSIILHVAVGRRWPFTAGEADPDGA